MKYIVLAVGMLIFATAPNIKPANYLYTSADLACSMIGGFLFNNYINKVNALAPALTKEPLLEAAYTLKYGKFLFKGCLLTGQVEAIVFLARTATKKGFVNTSKLSDPMLVLLNNESMWFAYEHIASKVIIAGLLTMYINRVNATIRHLGASTEAQHNAGGKDLLMKTLQLLAQAKKVAQLTLAHQAFTALYETATLNHPIMP